MDPKIESKIQNALEGLFAAVSQLQFAYLANHSPWMAV